MKDDSYPRWCQLLQSPLGQAAPSQASQLGRIISDKPWVNILSILNYFQIPGKSDKDKGGESPKEEEVKEEDKDPATKAKEKLAQRIDMYKVTIDESELNLRRNRIMGGVIYFDMLFIPPQPKKVASWVICELEHPQVLSLLPWLLTPDAGAEEPALGGRLPAPGSSGRELQCEEDA